MTTSSQPTYYILHTTYYILHTTYYPSIGLSHLSVTFSPFELEFFCSLVSVFPWVPHLQSTVYLVLQYQVHCRLEMKSSRKTKSNEENNLNSKAETILSVCNHGAYMDNRVHLADQLLKFYIFQAISVLEELIESSVL